MQLRRIAGYVGLAHQAVRLLTAQEERVQSQVRRHLIERMGRLRGLPQKLGQMLSLGQENDTVGDEYSLLRESAEPLPWSAIEPVLAQAWGRAVGDVVSDIDHVGRAASLGQVHRATTRDGREVAVKVQYPGVRDAVETDLRMLGWLSAPLGGLNRGFDLRRYRHVIMEDLRHELDYCVEAAQQRRFGEWARRDPFLVVPRVIDELTSENVLVSEWQDGESWSEVQAEWGEPRRHALATQLLRAFLHGLFIEQLVHADLHPGNLRFRWAGEGPRLVLYDFGCVYAPSRDTVLTLMRLIRAATQRTEPPLPLFLKLGFSRDYLEPLADKLPALCQVMFEPFIAEHPVDLAQWRLGERAGDVLGCDRWNFRIAGPAEMVFLLRAFHGLIHYLRGLACPISWRRALAPCQQALASEMASMPVPAVAHRTRDFRSLARWLKIRVTEAGATKVELTSAAAAIDDLDQLLDDDLLTRIRGRHIELERIVRDIRKRGYTPGPVFEMQEGSKTIAVWLE